MNIFDEQFDLFNEVKSDGWLAEECILEWPFFSWKGKQEVQKALLQLTRHCTSFEQVFSAWSKDQGSFLYKLMQKNKPALWCGIWLMIDQGKVQKIQFIFDTFENFQDNEHLNLFGFDKTLEKQTLTVPGHQDQDVSAIMDVLQQFFLEQYGMPLQDTELAKNRLYAAALKAKNALQNHPEYRVVLPFFSANKIGPIQFGATVIKVDHSYKVIPG